MLGFILLVYFIVVHIEQTAYCCFSSFHSNKQTGIHVKITDHHMLFQLPSAPNSGSLRTKANHRQPQAFTTSPDKAKVTSHGECQTDGQSLRTERI